MISLSDRQLDIVTQVAKALPIEKARRLPRTDCRRPGGAARLPLYRRRRFRGCHSGACQLDAAQRGVIGISGNPELWRKANPIGRSPVR